MAVFGVLVLTLVLLGLVVILIGTGPLAMLLGAMQLVAVIALAAFFGFRSMEMPPPPAIAEPVDPPAQVAPQPQSYPLPVEAPGLLAA